MTVQRLLFLEFPPDGPSKEEPSLLELFLNFSRLGPSEEVPSGGERPKLCFREQTKKDHEKGDLVSHTTAENRLSLGPCLSPLSHPVACRGSGFGYKHGFTGGCQLSHLR